ncbi:MAG TPA: hypothetical protein VFQ45_21275 [Longimicrobium sp.]|nr:hypothetical protein [Longimicrobium sp.]
MSDPGLVVPIRLEALLVGARDAVDADNFFPAYADFSALPYKGGSRREPYLSTLALNQPFTGNAPFPQGIHLHWNVPKALRQGVYDADGNLSVPAAPNRWLVTRVMVDTTQAQAPRTTLTSWVVESDYLSADPTYSETSVPQDASRGKSFGYLGRVYTLSDWLSEGGRGTYLAPLTAMGFGVPDFSSYYPNCRNVFGFLDDTLNDAGYDTDATSLAYVVTGWYADPTQDPLYGNPIGGADNDLGWLFSGDGTPAYSLYSGAVRAVGWEPEIAYFPNYDTPLNPDVAVGNTPEEALSALVASELSGDDLPGVEPLLNALQLGVLQTLDSADGLATLDEAEFNAEFSAVTGGTVWDVRPVNAAGTAPQDVPVSPYADVSLDTTHALEQLNDVQRQMDALSQQATWLQGQIFADWQKYMTVMYAGDPQDYPSVNDIYTYVNDEIAALDAITGTDGSLAALQAQAAELQATITAALPDTLQLVSSAGPRFYAANDPVVLLSGDGVPGSPPDNGDSVQCVLTDGIATAVTLPAGLVAGSAETTLDASALPTVEGALPYDALAALVQQAELLDPSTPTVVAAAVAALGGGGNPAALDFDATAQALSDAAAALLDGTAPANGVAFTGAPPQADVGLRAWAIPWNPIALSWRFSWRAPQALADAGGAYPPTFVTDNFTWDEDAQSWTLSPQSVSDTLQGYSGTVLLSPDASISLQAQIEAYLAYYPDGAESDELREILADMSDLPILAQSLAGVDDAMLMLEPTMQLPVYDPMASMQMYAEFSDQTVPAAVGAETTRSALPGNTYLPLRAGRAQLETLVLVDEFGRYRTVDVTDPILSSTLPSDGASPPALWPPLRLAQAARLDFRWLSATDPAEESTSLPDSSPICGWVVPNHLDDSLMFYDAGGGSIGSLTPSGDGVAEVWQTAPGAGPADQSMDDAFAGANAVLAAFAKSVWDGGAGYLEALVATFDRTRTLISPGGYAQDRATAVLIGTPLAIVQASLNLTLQGLPAPDQGWDALRTDMAGGDPLARTTHGFPQVEFPVFLGNLAALSDGLVGFFTTDGDGAVDFGTFWAGMADGSDPHIAAPTAQTLSVAADPDAAARMVTLLIDPRASVHAMTGIAPIKELTVSSDVYATALDAMTYTFLTSPVLVLPGGFAIPVPAEGGGTWSWVEYARGAWAEGGIAAVNFNATLQTPGQVAEGWLKLTPNS